MINIKNKNHLILAFVVVFSICIGMSCIAASEIDQKTLDTDKGSGPILDDNNDFTMSARYNGGTGYMWKVSPETHGADVSAPRYVLDHPVRCGGSGTVYFDVHVTSDDYYVKLILVGPTGQVVDEIDSDMVN